MRVRVAAHKVICHSTCTGTTNLKHLFLYILAALRLVPRLLLATTLGYPSITIEKVTNQVTFKKPSNAATALSLLRSSHFDPTLLEAFSRNLSQTLT